MVPENRAQLGVFLPEQTSRDLIVHNLGQVADVPTIHTPMRFVEAEVTPYTRKSERTNGESQARERITTGWDIAPATAIKAGRRRNVPKARRQNVQWSQVAPDES